MEIENCECKKCSHIDDTRGKCKVAKCWQVTELAHKKISSAEGECDKKRKEKKNPFSVFHFSIYCVYAMLICAACQVAVTKQPGTSAAIPEDSWRDSYPMTDGLADWQTDRRDTSVVALCFGSLALHFLQSLWQLNIWLRLVDGGRLPVVVGMGLSHAQLHSLNGHLHSHFIYTTCELTTISTD